MIAESGVFEKGTPLADAAVLSTAPRTVLVRILPEGAYQDIASGDFVFTIALVLIAVLISASIVDRATDVHMLPDFMTSTLGIGIWIAIFLAMFLAMFRWRKRLRGRVQTMLLEKPPVNWPDWVLRQTLACVRLGRVDPEELLKSINTATAVFGPRPTLILINCSLPPTSSDDPIGEQVDLRVGGLPYAAGRKKTWLALIPGLIMLGVLVFIGGRGSNIFLFACGVMLVGPILRLLSMYNLRPIETGAAFIEKGRAGFTSFGSLREFTPTDSVLFIGNVRLHGLRSFFGLKSTTDPMAAMFVRNDGAVSRATFFDEGDPRYAALVARWCA